jgi:hypothetical protein
MILVLFASIPGNHFKIGCLKSQPYMLKKLF